MDNPLLDLLIDVRDNVGVKHPGTWAKLDEAIALVEQAKVVNLPELCHVADVPGLWIPLRAPVVATKDDIKDARAAIGAYSEVGAAHVTNDRHLERVALAIAKSRAERKKT